MHGRVQLMLFVKHLATLSPGFPDQIFRISEEKKIEILIKCWTLL